MPLRYIPSPLPVKSPLDVIIQVVEESVEYTPLANVKMLL